MPDLLREQPKPKKEQPATVESTATSAVDPPAPVEAERPSPVGGEFHSEDFASGSPDDFESDAWRKEMQAELGIDGDQEVDFENDEWEKDLANELEDLQKEIDC